MDEISIYDTSGGQFDRPASTTTVAVGRARLVFNDCASATLPYRFDAGRSGTLDLARIGPTPPGCALQQRDRTRRRRGGCGLSSA